jgi:hypothetical protein
LLGGRSRIVEVEERRNEADVIRVSAWMDEDDDGVVHGLTPSALQTIGSRRI